MAGRLRVIPDAVEEFTGYSLGVDMIAWDFSSSASEFRANGKANVRNVQLPAYYFHVTVAATSHLARNQAMREWLNAYPRTPASRSPTASRLGPDLAIHKIYDGAGSSAARRSKSCVRTCAR